MPRERFVSKFDAAMYFGLRGLTVVATVMALNYGVKSTVTGDNALPKIFGYTLPDPYGSADAPTAPKAAQSLPSSTVTLPAGLLKEPIGPIML